MCSLRVSRSWEEEAIALATRHVSTASHPGFILRVLGLGVALGSLWSMLPVSLEAPFRGFVQHSSPLGPTDSLRTAVRKAVSDVPDWDCGAAPAGPAPRDLLPWRPYPSPGGTEPRAAPRTRKPSALGTGGRGPVEAGGRPEIGDRAARSRWELVHEYPTQLNLPTLLDVDPGAARAGRSDAVDAPLWLLRPRTGGPPR